MPAAWISTNRQARFIQEKLYSAAARTVSHSYNTIVALILRRISTVFRLSFLIIDVVGFRNHRKCSSILAARWRIFKGPMVCAPEMLKSRRPCVIVQISAMLPTFLTEKSLKIMTKMGIREHCKKTTAVLVSFPFALGTLRTRLCKIRDVFAQLFSSDQGFGPWQNWGVFCCDDVTIDWKFRRQKDLKKQIAAFKFIADPFFYHSKESPEHDHWRASYLGALLGPGIPEHWSRSCNVVEKEDRPLSCIDCRSVCNTRPQLIAASSHSSYRASS